MARRMRALKKYIVYAADEVDGVLEVSEIPGFEGIEVRLRSGTTEVSLVLDQAAVVELRDEILPGKYSITGLRMNDDPEGDEA